MHFAITNHDFVMRGNCFCKKLKYKIHHLSCLSLRNYFPSTCIFRTKIDQLMNYYTIDAQYKAVSIELRIHLFNHTLLQIWRSMVTFYAASIALIEITALYFYRIPTEQESGV